MIILISVVLGVIAYFGNKYIRKYFSVLVGVSIAISIFSLFIETDVIEIITQGLIGLAFYVVVMLTGAFKRDSKLSKRLRRVRKEYSIIGFILLIPHGLIYIIQFIDGSYPVEWYGIIAMIVMLPLFVISFTRIKRKMSIMTWTKIQQWAYLGYALIFIHLIIVSEGANQIAYLIIFGLYSILKLKNFVLNTTNRRKVSGLIKVSIVFTLLIGGISMLNFPISNVDGVSFDERTLTDGTYLAANSGFKNLGMELEVTIEDGVVTNIEMIDCGCTAPHHGTDYEQAAQDIIDDIISLQSTEIDTVSGATTTSKSVLTAVEEAIEDAKK